MARSIKINKAAGKGDGFNNPPGNSYGIVGGDTSLPGEQIQCRVKIGANAEADGFIIRQKGARKFLVKDGAANVGTCVLIDAANGALTANTMTVSAGSVRFARLFSKWGIGFDGTRYLMTFNDAAADVGGYTLLSISSDVDPGGEEPVGGGGGGGSNFVFDGTSTPGNNFVF